MLRLLVIVAVYYLIFGYAQLTAAWLLFPAWRPETPELLALLAGPAAGWLLHQARRNAASRWVLRAVYLWLGLGFLLLWVVVPVHLLRLLGLPAGSAALLLACVYVPLAVWSVVNAHRIAVRRMALSSRKLDCSLRLVQVSDVHVGSRGPGFLPRIVRRVDALEPDAVFITGDLLDLMGLPADSLDSIGKLSAPAFFAIGNHERYVGSEAVCARLEALGVTVLRNAAVDRGALRVMGIDDAEARDQVERQLARIEVADHRPAAYTVLMYHRPDGVRAAARAGVDLMLCGHTHNGQILPFNWMVKRFFPFIAGRFDIGDMALYVSPGTGTWGPTLRLGSVNEITLFELTPEARGGRGGPPGRESARSEGPD